MRVGILVPQSKSYAGIGKEFVNGFKLGGQQHEVVVEGIGFGENSNLITDKFDKLTLQENVDCIIGLVGDYDLVSVYEKANVLNVPTILARFGAFPDLEYPQNRYVMSISYGICDALAQVGTWCKKKGWNKIGVSGSFNDIGYGFVQVLESSLYSEGCEFSGHYTPPLNPREDEADHLTTFYNEVQSDVICQFYNGIFARENAEYIASYPNKITTPLLFTPFGIDHEILQKVYPVAQELYVIGSWLPVSVTGVEGAFEREYSGAFGSSPGATSVLGFECALAIESLQQRDAIIAGEKVNVESPRGTLTWSDALRLNIPTKLWKAESEGTNVYLSEQLEDIEEHAVTETFEGQENGWHNAYLCY